MKPAIGFVLDYATPIPDSVPHMCIEASEDVYGNPSPWKTVFYDANMSDITLNLKIIIDSIGVNCLKSLYYRDIKGHGVALL